MRMMHSSVRALVFALCVLPALLGCRACCDDVADFPELGFVIPQEYRGPIALVAVGAGGLDLSVEQELDLVAGGPLVVVQSLDRIERRHYVVARSPSGEPILDLQVLGTAIDSEVEYPVHWLYRGDVGRAERFMYGRGAGGRRVAWLMRNGLAARLDEVARSR